MSQHNIHTTSIYNTYNQSGSFQSSRNSTYAPTTNHYNQPHVAKSLSPADTTPDDIDLNHPANWGIFDDPSQLPRRPKWERKSSAVTHSYPVKNYDSSRQATPTTSGTGLPTPHSSYQPTFRQHTSSLYGRAPLQPSPYSSTGPLPLPQESYTYTAHGAPFMAGNAVPVSTQPPNQGFAAPYTGTHTYPPRGTAPTSIPLQGISRHVAPASAQSRPPIPSEWHQSSSQTPHMEAPPAEPRDKERQKPRRPARQSKLDGIPRDQMQRFRIVDMGPGPSSSSGSKRTRSPGSDALPDAKVRATVQDDANGGSKGKGKAKLSLEEEKLLEKRKKEADRVQNYRNVVDDAYDGLRAALYPDEEQRVSVRSEHGKLKCLRDATERVRNSVSKAVFEEQRATLEGRICALLTEKADQDRRLARLLPGAARSHPVYETSRVDVHSMQSHAS